jgi:hypothetical protein
MPWRARTTLATWPRRSHYCSLCRLAIPSCRGRERWLIRQGTLNGRARADCADPPPDGVIVHADEIRLDTGQLSRESENGPRVTASCPTGPTLPSRTGLARRTRLVRIRARGMVAPDGQTFVTEGTTRSTKPVASHSLRITSRCGSPARRMESDPTKASPSTSPDRTLRLDALESEASIRRVMVKYLEPGDAHDRITVASLFTPDGIWHAVGSTGALLGTHEGTEAIAVASRPRSIRCSSAFTS